MATVTALTAERMLAIEAASIVDGSVVGDDLILEARDGSTINAGDVRGPEGPPGDPGSIEAWRTIGGGGEPAFLNNWINHGGANQVAQFRKENDIVRLRGLVKNGDVGTAGFQLPVGYRPPANVHFVVDTNQNPGFVYINVAGDVMLNNVVNTYVSLSQIAFSVT